MADLSPAPLAASSASAALADRIATAPRRILRACRAAGRPEGTVTLVAVTKTQPPRAVAAARAAGLTVFGENRVQEAQGRWSEGRWGPDAAAGTAPELRLIGPLQTNKAADAIALFDVIETLDREKLARALADAGMKLGRRPRVLVQVNTGAEPQKAGVLPGEVPALIAAARSLDLAVEGLMCIPPVDEAAGPHFALLAKLAAREGLPVLSMGMSDDYEIAIRFGATHVRLGSALFGPRG
ncbi:MAG: YggS family pyridoxal phosphate-dependent enzyme [Brevundimonas sp.]|uniref:YggS family pyridoxal phosphate-dependent enzyme n=1 Tax=Brevundimonas sp. TaxID=1871086 RepID=UPI003918981D